MPSGTSYESGYGTGDTVRHSKCTVIITDPSSERCEFCAHFRATLFNIRRRLKVKQQTVHANTRNNYLKPKELRHKLNNANKENRQIKRKLNSVYDQVKESVRKDGVTLELGLNKSCSQMATDLKEQLLSSFKEDTPEHILVTEQLRAVNTTNAKNMRWHPTFLRWCINLYGKSPAAYRMIKGSKFLILPHESTLRDYTSFLRVSPGINVQIIENVVKDMEEKMELDTFRNNVALVFDEIKIKSGLVYSKSTGKLKGFVSLGEMNSVNHDFARHGENDEQLASHVIAFMVRGMFSHLKEVFAYYPCTGFTSDQLFWAVWEAVFVLEGCGLKVRAFVSDGASPNRKFYRIHALPDSDTPVNSATNLYDLSRNIYFVCDVPHLIKTTRNNLENSNWNNRTRLLRWLTDEFLFFLEEWEQQCLATPGLSMSEKRRMCVSRETLEGLRITVKSFVQLTNELLAVDGVRYFLSERLSQDPIEEFFSKVRGHLGHNCHPTLNQFESALVHIHTLGGQDMQATRHGNINWRGDGMLLNPSNLNRRHRRADD